MKYQKTAAVTAAVLLSLRSGQNWFRFRDCTARAEQIARLNRPFIWKRVLQAAACRSASGTEERFGVSVLIDRKDQEMKIQTKIMILAGVLGLCLLLTGCGQPSDTPGAETGAAQTPEHFATYPPSQTIVFGQDASDGDTENSGEEEAVSVPVQPPAGAEAWTGLASSTAPLFPDTTPAPADTCTAAPVTSVPVVTPVPTEGPSPTPKSIQRGFTGSDAVREIQRRLKELGYYTGSADGDFGPATEKAVIAFQKANKLTADGKVGEKTLAKLNGSNATPARGSESASKTARPTATPKITKDTYLESGKSGKQVRTMQKRLIELGWLSGSASGTYDSTTEAAVIAFQKKAKLWADGKAGPKTLEVLYSSKAPKSSKPVSAAGSEETLEIGSKGSDVKKLQKRLKDLGYLNGTADGTFGAATEAAVIAFQESNGLHPDGKAGIATQNKLYSDSAKKYAGNTDDET